MDRPPKPRVAISIPKEDLEKRRWNLFVRAMRLALRELGVKDVRVNALGGTGMGDPFPPGPNWEFEVEATPKCDELVTWDECPGVK